jgi:hypothetical protein
MMRRFVLIALLLLVACQGIPARQAPPATSTPAPPSPSLAPSATHTLTSTPPPPTSTFTPIPATLTPTRSSSTAFTVHLHPDGPLYVGDQVSLEVITPEGLDFQGDSVYVHVDVAGGTQTLEGKFARYGIGGRSQATLLWAWDTTGLPAGDYSLDLSIPMERLEWSESVSLLPAEQVPPPEPGAAWARAETDCCLVYYITGTAAERDLPALLQTVEQQAEKAVRQLGPLSEKPLEITFLPRVLGHGGFTGQEISVSYLDRNYAGNHPDVVVHHEMIHALDARLGGELRPTMLVEGLAVYLTGGHFKYEPLMPRAADLLPPKPGCIPAKQVLAGNPGPVCSLGWYLPLVPLLDQFYNSQHEIGYLEAGSLVEFMVKTWGWAAFSAFYRDIHPQNETGEEVPHSAGPQARAVNAALVAHFGITIEQLEQRYLNALEAEALLPELEEDVRLSVGFYDTLRRYQQLLDPSAYFLTAWLPEGSQMREKGIVADYLRRPPGLENAVIEAMLVEADHGVLNGEFSTVEQILGAVNAVLDSVETGEAEPFSYNALASDYFSLAQFLLAQGYATLQIQRLEVEGNTARAWVTTSGLEVEILSVEKSTGGWNLTGTQTPPPQ